VPARGRRAVADPAALPPARHGPRGGDGVCAGVDFLSPRSLVSMLLGRERDDPWDPDRLVWPLLEVIDASLGEEWCATWPRTSATVTGDEASCAATAATRRPAAGRPLRVVRRAAAALVADWREGRDTDGLGGPLDGDLRWQPELWRRLRRARRGAAARRPPRPHARRAARDGASGAARPAGGSRCSATPGSRSPRSSCSPRSASTATCTCGCRRPRTPPGTPGRAVAGGPCRATTTSRPHLVGTRCSPRSGATPASCSAPWPGRRAPEPATRWPPVPTDHEPAPRHLLGWLQHDLRANRCPRPGPRAAPETSTTAASRCTPATAGPPGRGAPRGAGRAARRRPDPRAARHPGDVPRRRDVRAADRGHRSARTVPRTTRPGASRPPAAGAARRPGAAPDQPAARRARARCSSSARRPG
jgi:exodeoxyribonuclease V gamma subunit